MQLSDKYGVSVSTIQRRLREVHTTRIVSKDKDVVVLMDASYWGRDFGVLVFKDALRGKILWRKFLDKKETRADYMEGVEWLEQNGFRIHGVAIDGLKGLAQMLSKYKVQYCQFHQVKAVKKYLTNKQKTQAGIELKAIALMLCHTDKESFIGVLDEWYEHWQTFLKERTRDTATGKTCYTHKRLRSAYLSLKHNMPWLWTWYDYIEDKIPNTNNGVEAQFTDLKTKLRIHNGLSIKHRKVFIDEYFRLSYDKFTHRFDH